jgi:hypothetical protein
LARGDIADYRPRQHDSGAGAEAFQHAAQNQQILIPPLLARIHAEERLLRSQFGGEYEVYCNRTSRLIPGVY